MEISKDTDLDRIAELVSGAHNITVLTGAGMSAESGIATFRGASDSLWSRFDPQRLASPDGWREDRQFVWAWYRWRMAQVRRAQPNAGHFALARLANRKPGLTLLTQNVDDLHERAGSRDPIHLHGELFALRCFACGRPGDAIDIPDEAADAPPVRLEPPDCLRCGGKLRPSVVWFGEPMPEDPWRSAEAAAKQCDLMLVIGTSGEVYPAALLPMIARQHGARVVEINPDETALTGIADVSWRTTAALGLPQLNSP